MELGNMLFGNSRGRFEIERGEGFEDELFRLLVIISPDNYTYADEFENYIFHVFPYYWGDCTCGYEKAEREFCEKTKHEDGCYHIQYDSLPDDFSSKYKESELWREKYLKPLYKKFGFDTEGTDWWYGCAVRCTCSYEKKWEKFFDEYSHKKDCPIVKPNFLYKPTNFEIKWYKYPLRDSYMNQDISLDEFRKIIDSCIESLKENNDAIS